MTDLVPVSVALRIDRLYREAVSRIYEMHSVGTGVCHCGTDMEGHPVWDTHSPVEMYRDKSFGPT